MVNIKSRLMLPDFHCLLFENILVTLYIQNLSKKALTLYFMVYLFNKEFGDIFHFLILFREF